MDEKQAGGKDRRYRVQGTSRVCWLLAIFKLMQAAWSSKLFFINSPTKARCFGPGLAGIHSLVMATATLCCPGQLREVETPPTIGTVPGNTSRHKKNGHLRPLVKMNRQAICL
ncbi:hypothetical protein A9Q98_12300 [Thalassotalea sp. 42_200_T64]|nr:hypothetical protein A9Q98_12300 [Thalassotalea sp. 42_200_T64]